MPTDRFPEQQLHEQVAPNEELSDVLSWGERVGLIDPAIAPASSLVEHTDRLGVRTVCRGGQGLMSASALAKTAAEFGLSPGTVRRQTGAAEHRRARAGLPVGPNRAFDLSARGCCANWASSCVTPSESAAKVIRMRTGEMVAGFGGICKNSKPGRGEAGACAG